MCWVDYSHRVKSFGTELEKENSPNVTLAKNEIVLARTCIRLTKCFERDSDYLPNDSIKVLAMKGSGSGMYSWYRQRTLCKDKRLTMDLVSSLV